MQNTHKVKSNSAYHQRSEVIVFHGQSRDVRVPLQALWQREQTLSLQLHREPLSLLSLLFRHLHSHLSPYQGLLQTLSSRVVCNGFEREINARAVLDEGNRGGVSVRGSGQIERCMAFAISCVGECARHYEFYHHWGFAALHRRVEGSLWKMQV